MKMISSPGWSQCNLMLTFATSIILRNATIVVIAYNHHKTNGKVIIMINETCMSIVKLALMKKFVLVNKLMNTTIDSDEFFNALSEYDELFWNTHKELSKVCEPYILSPNWDDVKIGTSCLEKYFKLFKKQRTPAEQKASELCLKYL